MNLVTTEGDNINNGQRKFQRPKDSVATKEFNIQIPCRLAERVESYASKNHTEITMIVIEALDAFLRENQ